jgi:enolase
VPSAPPPAPTRRSSCATATRSATSARACSRPCQRRTARSPRRCSAQPADDQYLIDALLLRVDGTKNKAKLGANAILGAQPRRRQGAADSIGLPLYRYLGGSPRRRLPVPMMNILNGGAHADNNVDFQEFMVMPVGASNFREGLRMGVEVFHALKAELKKQKLMTAVGDEGGFAPNLESNAAAFEIILRRSRRPATRPAATSCWRSTRRSPSSTTKGKYTLAGEGQDARSQGHGRALRELVRQFPIFSIEDGMAEDDWEGWQALTEKIGGRVQLVGDDLFVTNTARLQRGIEREGRQRDPDQGQPDRHADRDPRSDRHGPPPPASRRDVAPLGRDRGHHHRRSRGRHQLRPDQDRRAVPQRSRREVQPAAAHRGAARRTACAAR